MMICFSGRQRRPPTPKSKLLVKQLRWLMIFEIFFGSVGILIGNMAGIIFLIKALILYISYHGLDPCYCVAYQCLNLTTMYCDIACLGVVLQNGWPLVTEDNYTNQSNLLYAINLLFGFVVIYPVFMGYREFKGIQMDQINDNERHSDGGFSQSEQSINYQVNSVNNIPENEEAQPQQQEMPHSINDSQSNQNIVVNNVENEEEEKINREEEEEKNKENEVITIKNESFPQNQEIKTYNEPFNINHNKNINEPNKNGRNENNNNINNENFQPFKGKSVLIGKTG